MSISDSKELNEYALVSIFDNYSDPRRSILIHYKFAKSGFLSRGALESVLLDQLVESCIRNR